MKKFVCTVCGYVHEGDAAPAECPVCHAPASKFKEQEEMCIRDRIITAYKYTSVRQFKG